MKNISKIIMVLVCLAFVSVSAWAQGGGGFTANLDAGYSATGSYTTQHTITQSGTTTCGGSSIPKWYLVGSGLYFSNCNPRPGFTGDSGDFDSDGCTNIQEYQNFLANHNSQPLPNPNCFCNHNTKCEFNFGEKYPACSDCISGCYVSNQICEPEHGEWYSSNDPFNSCSDCLGYTFSLQEGVGEVPEFSGTALIIIFILSVVAYAFISHFHKE